MNEDQFNALVTLVQGLARHYAQLARDGSASPSAEEESIDDARRVLVEEPEADPVVPCTPEELHHALIDLLPSVYGPEPESAVQIFSIFGQIEAVAAELFIKRGRAMCIDASEIPPTAAVNAEGQFALFAVIIPREHVADFERLIEDLYS